MSRGFRITAPHFVAGIEVEDGYVVRAAPILAYMVGWNGKRFASYLGKKGWGWESLG